MAKVGNMTLDDLRDSYKFELERKDKLSNSLTLPVGVLTIIGSLLGLLSKDFSFRDENLSWFFGVPIVVGAVLFAIAAVLIILAYYHYRYDYVPTPRDIREHEEKLRSYYEATLDGDKALAAQRATEYMATMISKLYEEAVYVNAKNNDTKSAYMHNASSFLIGSLAFVMLAVVPYTIDARAKGKEVYEVRVVNSQDLNKISTEVKQDGHSGTGQDGRPQAARARANSSSPISTRPREPADQRKLHPGAR